MIFIALGSNLPHPDYGKPIDVCREAVSRLSQRGIRVVASSRWYRSSPVPDLDQPDFVNGMVSVETDLSPAGLLVELQGIEREFGRVRTAPNAARILDLDLISYNDIVANSEQLLILPHPRLSERAFVLLPLKEIAPNWIHPISGLSISRLADEVPKSQKCYRI